MSAESIGIRQYQIIQEERDRILVKAVLDPQAQNDTLSKLALNLGQLIPEPVTVETKAVDSIPKEPSGKYRVVSSKAI